MLYCCYYYIVYMKCGIPRLQLQFNQMHSLIHHFKYFYFWMWNRAILPFWLAAIDRFRHQTMNFWCRMFIDYLFGTETVPILKQNEIMVVFAVFGIDIQKFLLPIYSSPAFENDKLKWTLSWKNSMHFPEYIVLLTSRVQELDTLIFSLYDAISKPPPLE